jgi:RNA polymerase sigma-70 factor (ECF subfamily)
MDELSQLNDSDLVSQCLKLGSRDERPFVELFQRHQAYVSRLLWRYFPSEQDVEDLTQEVFFKVYRNLNQFQHKSSLKTWIFTITMNTAKNEIRTRSRRPAVLDQINQDLENFIPEEADVTQIEEIGHLREIEHAFVQLSPQEQEILNLKDKEGMTYKEIADHLGITESAAKMRVQRSRLNMKKKYLEIQYEQ